MFQFRPVCFDSALNFMDVNAIIAANNDRKAGCIFRGAEGDAAMGKTRTDGELKNLGLHDEPESLVPSAREQVKEQVANALPKGAVRLLKVLKGEMSVLDMMMALKLGGRRNFLEKYLTPSIELGLVEMTQPNSPRSPTQEYRLTPSRRRKAGSARNEPHGRAAIYCGQKRRGRNKLRPSRR